MTPMTSQEIELKVRQLLSERSGVALDEITAETRIAEDLGVDSFGSVELMFEIEEAFGLEIPDGDIMHVRSREGHHPPLPGGLVQPHVPPAGVIPTPEAAPLFRLP